MSVTLSLGREHHELDILLFHEVLDHMSRVDRVLTAPGGSLLLAGRSGAGRGTAVALVTHMHQLELFTPHISRNYGLKQFRNDLKNVRNIHVYASGKCVNLHYAHGMHMSLSSPRCRVGICRLRPRKLQFSTRTHIHIKITVNWLFGMQRLPVYSLDHGKTAHPPAE